MRTLHAGCGHNPALEADGGAQIGMTRCSSPLQIHIDLEGESSPLSSFLTLLTRWWTRGGGWSTYFPGLKPLLFLPHLDSPGICSTPSRTRAEFKSLSLSIQVSKAFTTGGDLKLETPDGPIFTSACPSVFSVDQPMSVCARDDPFVSLTSSFNCLASARLVRCRGLTASCGTMYGIVFFYDGSIARPCLHTS